MFKRVEVPPARSVRTGPRRPLRPAPWLPLFAVALAVRLLAAWLAGGWSGPVARPPELAIVTENLARGAGFSLDHHGNPAPTAAVAPLVPWLMGAARRADARLPIVIQCVLGALTAVLVGAFAAGTFGGPVGRLAGWLAGLSPLLLLHSGELDIEVGLTAAMMAALGVTAMWIKTPRPGRALGAGMMWGAAILAGDSVLAAPLLVLAWAWIPLGLTVAPGDRLRQVSFMLLGVALVVGPWAARNAVVFRAFVPVTTSAGWSLLDGNNSMVWNEPAWRGGGIRTRDVEPWSQWSALSEPRGERAAAGAALDYVRSHAAQWPRVAVAKLGHLWSVASLQPFDLPYAAADPAGAPPPLLRARFGLLAVWSILVLPVALWGLVRTLSGGRRWFQSLPLLLIVYFSLEAMLFYGSLRGRIPIEPLLLVFAAAGLEDARRLARGRTRGMRVIEGRPGLRVER